jgi:hypothetical protein
MSSRMRSSGRNGPRARRTWSRRVPEPGSCSIGQRNRLLPRCSSPFWLVRCQFSSAAKHVSNGMSTIRQNDSDLGTENMLAPSPGSPRSVPGSSARIGGLAIVAAPFACNPERLRRAMRGALPNDTMPARNVAAVCRRCAGDVDADGGFMTDDDMRRPVRSRRSGRWPARSGCATASAQLGLECCAYGRPAGCWRSCAPDPGRPTWRGAYVAVSSAGWACRPAGACRELPGCPASAGRGGSGGPAPSTRRRLAGHQRSGRRRRSW